MWVLAGRGGRRLLLHSEDFLKLFSFIFTVLVPLDIFLSRFLPFYLSIFLSFSCFLSFFHLFSLSHTHWFALLCFKADQKYVTLTFSAFILFHALILCITSCVSCYLKYMYLYVFLSFLYSHSINNSLLLWIYVFLSYYILQVYFFQSGNIVLWYKTWKYQTNLLNITHADFCCGSATQKHTHTHLLLLYLWGLTLTTLITTTCLTLNLKLNITKF